MTNRILSICRICLDQYFVLNCVLQIMCFLEYSLCCLIIVSSADSNINMSIHFLSLTFHFCPHRFCSRSLLHDFLDHSLIDKIPGRQNDRKTLLGELNWIFTAVTDTIAWNVLPHGIRVYTGC